MSNGKQLSKQQEYESGVIEDFSDAKLFAILYVETNTGLLLLSRLVLSSSPTSYRSSGRGSCYLCIGIFVVMVFLISIGGEDASVNNDNLRSGQAKHLHPTNPQAPAVTGGGGEEGGEGTAGSEGSLSSGGSSEYDNSGEQQYQGGGGGELVTEVNTELTNAETAELESDKSLLIAALGTAGHRLRKGLSKMLGKKATKEEVEEIAKEIETGTKPLYIV